MNLSTTKGGLAMGQRDGGGTYETAEDGAQVVPSVEPILNFREV